MLEVSTSCSYKDYSVQLQMYRLLHFPLNHISLYIISLFIDERVKRLKSCKLVGEARSEERRGSDIYLAGEPPITSFLAPCRPIPSLPCGHSCTQHIKPCYFTPPSLSLSFSFLYTCSSPLSHPLLPYFLEMSKHRIIKEYITRQG